MVVKLPLPVLRAYPERRPLLLPLSMLILRPEEAPTAEPLRRPPFTLGAFVVEELEALARLFEDRFLVGGEEEEAGVELDLSPASTELNQRFFLDLDGVDAGRLLVSSLSLLSLILSLSLVAAVLLAFCSDFEGVPSVLGVISTSSASRYHFRRRV